jgi:hypothetical protein
MQSRRSAGSAVVYDLDVRVSLAVQLELYGRVDRHPPQRGQSRLFVSCILQRHHGSIPPWVANFEPDKSFQLDAAVLFRALGTAPSLSADRPSGLLYEHYRDVLAEEDPAAFAAFHVVCSLVARRQMPPRARAALSSCGLLARANSIDGQPDGVSPLAVREVLHMLVACAVDLQLRDRF